MTPHPPQCACVSCLVPDGPLERCTAHVNCVARNGHAGERLGLRRYARLIVSDLKERIWRKLT